MIYWITACLECRTCVGAAHTQEHTGKGITARHTSHTHFVDLCLLPQDRCVNWEKKVTQQRLTLLKFTSSMASTLACSLTVIFRCETKAALKYEEQLVHFPATLHMPPSPHTGVREDWSGCAAHPTSNWLIAQNSFPFIERNTQRQVREENVSNAVSVMKFIVWLSTTPLTAISPHCRAVSPLLH